QTFHFALNPGGYLMLGGSETADGSDELFVSVDDGLKLYETRALPIRPIPPVPPISTVTRPPSRGIGAAAPPAPFYPANDRLSPPELHMQLIEMLAPPSVAVDQDHHVVHLSPHVGRYLHLPGGEYSRDLLKLVRPELRLELRSALYQAGSARTTVAVPPLQIVEAGGPRAVKMQVRPDLDDGDPPRGFFLVTFEDVAVDGSAPIDAPVAVTLNADLAGQLEEELSRVKAQLRETIEQHETQVEEAKASNEELQAVNEELRSAAEELETSKEELQSVNEELSTVNQELKIKIDELGLTNNHFQNLINSTQIGTIFLDRSLRVKMSTPSARDVFNLLPLDVGRPLSDITSSIGYDSLADDASEVLERLQTVEREIQSRAGRWFLVRVLPYRTTDQRIEGVVLTFQDVTDRRTAEASVRASEERLRLLIDSVKDYAIFTITAEGLVATWNAGAKRMFGYDEDEIVGKPFAILFTDEDQRAGVPLEELATARRQGRAEDERWHRRRDGTGLYCSGVTTVLDDPSRGFAKIARDLTGPRDAAEALRRAHESVEARVRARTVHLQGEVAARAEAEQRITTLVRQLVTAQEDERARIARDIHDHVGQQLTALRLALDRLESSSPAGSPDELARAQALAREIDAEVDFLAWELRPAALDDLGLVVAVSKYLTAWSEHHGVTAEFRTAGLKDQRLAPEIETSFYRITQEALNNIAKHAHATRVDVILERRGDLAVLVVEDDGVGFDDDGGALDEGLGLVSMRERAALAGATLQIETAPGKGTTIFVRRSLETRS
ncbi:MAG TPA: PAS domain-containing protein, partial [Vicinamibacterales bacterium]